MSRIFKYTVVYKTQNILLEIIFDVLFRRNASLVSVIF